MAARRSGAAAGGKAMNDLQEQLDRRTRELSEALEQQAATSEVLRVISSSPGDLETVFQSMLANATRICEAKFGTINFYDGDQFRIVAEYNVRLRSRQPDCAKARSNPMPAPRMLMWSGPSGSSTSKISPPRRLTAKAIRR